MEPYTENMKMHRINIGLKRNMTSKRWFGKGESERKSENKFWKVGGYPGGVGDLLILR